jgi:short chain dehydrogenase
VNLAGRVVIVTGASSGIGASTATLLHAAGAVPVLVARRADRLAPLDERLGGAPAVPADLTEPDAAERVVAAALDRFGRVDGLVNNAGVSLHHRIADLDLAEFRRVLDLNVVSLVAMTQAVLPAMRAAGGGGIVNVSSGTTRMAVPGVGPYAATKSRSTCSAPSREPSWLRTVSPCRWCCPRSRRRSSPAAGSSPAAPDRTGWSCTARTMSPRSSCAPYVRARSASTSRTAPNNPT